MFRRPTRIGLALASVGLLLLSVENAAAQTDGTYRIVTLGNVSLWNEDGKDTKMVTGKNTADEDATRFVLSKQADGSFKITTKANGRHLHVDGGGDKLLSTRYQPNDDFTRFLFEPQTDLSYRIKVKADGRYLRDAGGPDGGALGSAEQKDDSFSRFLLFDPDCKQFEICKVTFASSRTKDSEVFRITRNGDEVRHDTVLMVKAGQTAVLEMPAGFRWVVRDVDSKQELLRLATVTKRPVSFALADKSSTTVRVPNLVPLSKAAAETALQNVGLKAKSLEGVAPPDASKAGQVYNQSVQANASVATGTEITFFYYKAAAVALTVRVPNLVNLSKAAAETALQNVGLKARSQEGNAAPDASKAGQVYFQDLQANATVNAGTEVTILYYKAVNTVRVPNLQNLLRTEAETALRNAGLNPRGQEVNETNNPAQVGRVYAQSVPANTDVAPGTEIVFQTFKAAPAPVGNRVPNVVNLFKVDAEIALQRAGLSFQAIAGNTTTDDRLLGMVHAQSVPANSAVNPGQQITFQYYRLAPPVGVNEVKVPWVSNMSRWDAELRLLRHGFLPRAVKSSETDAMQRFDIVKGDIYDFTINNFRSTQDPKGHQGDGANERSLAAFGREVTYEYEFNKNQRVIGPYDAASASPVPNLIPLAHADDSLEIAWTRRDGKNYYSRFSGPNWATAQHQDLPNALRFLGGLAKDETGNTYLATARMEFLFSDQEKGVYRPNVLHLLRRGANQQSFDFFLDLNKQGFSPAIFNPQNMDNALFHPSRLAYGKGELAFAFGQNHGGGHTTSNLIGVGTDGTSKYSGSGAQHTTDVTVIFDGSDFVMAQGFEAGVGLSKLSKNGDKRTWSDHILVFKNEWRNRNGDFDSFIRLGGIAPLNDGYLLVLSHGRGAGANYGPQDWSLQEDAPIYTLKAPRNFETLKKFDWVMPGYKVPDLPGNFNPSVLMSPPRDRAFIRPTMVDLQNGKYLVLAEQWNWRNPKFEGTFGVVMNGNGQRFSEIKSLGLVRLHASNDAFYLPSSRKAAWVSGDTVNNRLNLYTVDENLNLQSYTLSLP